MRDAVTGARDGALYSAGGSVLGEGTGRLVGRTISRAAGTGPEDAWIARSSVELNGLPGGRVDGSGATPSQPPPPIPGSVAGPTVGESVSTLIGNAPNARRGQVSSHRGRGAPDM